MNIPLLRRIQEKIKLEPENFIMQQWHCGTARCIGGWATTLSSLPPCTIPSIALDIDYETQGVKLFFTENWPEEFRARWEENSWFAEDEEDEIERIANRALAAQIACDRIDHFIQTEGAE